MAKPLINLIGTTYADHIEAVDKEKRMHSCDRLGGVFNVAAALVNLRRELNVDFDICLTSCIGEKYMEYANKFFEENNVESNVAKIKENSSALILLDKNFVKFRVYADYVNNVVLLKNSLEKLKKGNISHFVYLNHYFDEKIIKLAREKSKILSADLCSEKSLQKNRIGILSAISKLDSLFANDEEIKILLKNQDLRECFSRITNLVRGRAYIHDSNGYYQLYRGTFNYFQRLSLLAGEEPFYNLGAGDYFAAIILLSCAVPNLIDTSKILPLVENLLRKLNRIVRKEIKAILFDIDGLLVDSESLYLISNKEYFSKYGINFTESMHQAFTGLKFEEWVGTLKNQFSSLTPSIDEIKKERTKIFFRIAKKKLGLFMGVVPLLRSLSKQNYKLAMVTSNKEEYLKMILQKFKNLEKYFSLIITGDMVKKGKPDPECYLIAAKRLGVETECCLVFEDALNGVAAAKNAGMKVVAIPSQFLRNADFSSADLVLGDLKEFDLDLLKSI